MSTGTMYSTLSPLIAASLSPVFLLSAIGTTLLIIDTRLNRIVARCRMLETSLRSPTDQDIRLEEELLFYLARANRIRWAVFSCTVASLFLALAVITLFLDAQTKVQLTPAVETLFVCAVLFLVTGLVLYMLDVLLVNRALDFTRSRMTDARAAAKAQPDAGKTLATRTDV
ncbi:MAG: DUF2721 domain-containing protein [Cereibacter sp.]